MPEGNKITFNSENKPSGLSEILEKLAKEQAVEGKEPVITARDGSKIYRANVTIDASATSEKIIIPGGTVGDFNARPNDDGTITFSHKLRESGVTIYSVTVKNGPDISFVDGKGNVTEGAKYLASTDSYSLSTVAPVATAEIQDISQLAERKAPKADSPAPAKIELAEAKLVVETDNRGKPVSINLVGKNGELIEGREGKSIEVTRLHIPSKQEMSFIDRADDILSRYKGQYNIKVEYGGVELNREELQLVYESGNPKKALVAIEQKREAIASAAGMVSSEVTAASGLAYNPGGQGVSGPIVRQ